jgi:type IV secretory pathway TraG/TraD family ATPase VirD4
MVMLDEFDQLGPMPIVEQALKQLAGHGARVSIITQSIPGLDNIYGENVRLSLESAAGMKLYLAANDKKTAGEISDAWARRRSFRCRTASRGIGISCSGGRSVGGWRSGHS